MTQNKQDKEWENEIREAFVPLMGCYAKAKNSDKAVPALKEFIDYLVAFIHRTRLQAKAQERNVKKCFWAHNPVIETASPYRKNGIRVGTKFFAKCSKCGMKKFGIAQGDFNKEELQCGMWWIRLYKE